MRKGQQQRREEASVRSDVLRIDVVRESSSCKPTHFTVEQIASGIHTTRCYWALSLLLEYSTEARWEQCAIFLIAIVKDGNIPSGIFRILFPFFSFSYPQTIFPFSGYAFFFQKILPNVEQGTSRTLPIACGFQRFEQFWCQLNYS